jgi:GNAT superfamily N-acetyltransferase
MNRTNIRRAATDDLFEIATLMHEAFVEYRSLYTEEGFLATTPTADQIAVRMTEGPVWVAEHDASIVGTVSVVPRGDDLYIRGMAVLPEARGLQLGQLLLKQVEDFARAQNHKRLVLSTTPFLLRAIRLYEGAGFQHSDEGLHDLFGTPLFTMVKLVTCADPT